LPGARPNSPLTSVPPTPRAPEGLDTPPIDHLSLGRSASFPRRDREVEGEGHPDPIHDEHDRRGSPPDSGTMERPGDEGGEDQRPYGGRATREQAERRVGLPLLAPRVAVPPEWHLRHHPKLPRRRDGPDLHLGDFGTRGPEPARHVGATADPSRSRSRPAHRQLPREHATPDPCQPLDRSSVQAPRSSVQLPNA